MWITVVYYTDPEVPEADDSVDHVAGPFDTETEADAYGKLWSYPAKNWYHASSYQVEPPKDPT